MLLWFFLWSRLRFGLRLGVGFTICDQLLGQFRVFFHQFGESRVRTAVEAFLLHGFFFRFFRIRFFPSDDFGNFGFEHLQVSDG